MADETPNLPLAFAALLVGGIVLEHGISTTKASFASAGTPSGVAAAAGGTGTSTTGLKFPSGSQTGKVSWFGGPSDPTAGPTTASGKPVSAPGIAVYNQATLGGYWLLQAPNGNQFVAQQTDIGPAPWTGRLFDFTYSLVQRIGYTIGNFPTDAQVTGFYLGKSVPSQYQGLLIS